MPNNISFHLSSLPLTQIAEFMRSSRPFTHASRTLPFHVLIYLVKGSLTVMEDYQEYVLTPGSLFFLKAGLHHWGEQPCKPGTTWIYVHFSFPQLPAEAPAFVPYSSYLQNQEFRPGDYEYTLTLPKLLEHLSGSPIENKLYHLAELFHSSNPLRAAYLNPLLMELLLDCYQIKEGEHNLHPRENITLSLIKYLEAHTHTPFDSSDIVSSTNLSYKYLCGLFKKKTGMTLLEYHTNLRMNEAAKLLRETSLSITEISIKMGYQEPLYFSNVFRKVHGISPRYYRAQYIY